MLGICCCKPSYNYRGFQFAAIFSISMDKEKLAELIYRVRNGMATTEEVEALEAYWQASQRLDTLHKDHTEEELVHIEHDLFERIHGAIGAPERRTRRLWTGTTLYRAAAVILVLMSVAFWFYTNRTPLREIRTDFGEKLAVTLPDQSTVVLNGNSTLRYAPDWDDGSFREIWIEGEGFFSVVHEKSDRKFVVHANQLIVEVLGTKFNVRARASVSEVMLTEGKVKLELPHRLDAEAIFLEPGEMLTMNEDGVSKRTVEKERITSWVENKLYFDRAPLREVAELLKDTYGLSVRFSSPEIAARELSGEISSATEEDILHAITEIFHLQFVRKGRSVLISERPGQ